MSEVKKCPECGRLMEKGYIISQAIRWSKKKHTQVAIGQELVVPWQLWGIPNIEAYRCSSCRLVSFHYGIPQADITPKSFLAKCVKCAEEIPIASDYCPKCGAKQKAEKGSQ